MGLKRTDEFRKDAVRIALTSGLTRKQVDGEPGSPAKVFRPPHKHLKWLVKSDHHSSCKTKLSYTPGGQSCKTIPNRKRKADEPG